uniref:uncharacterized protein LOC122584812 n=1 Tax=Erigeron canadensis TaxID=72917 RepID=UPI001CB8A4C9|nr:uncharacterized protein LOC122584812 [Erigeron canadensis]
MMKGMMKATSGTPSLFMNRPSNNFSSSSSRSSSLKLPQSSSLKLRQSSLSFSVSRPLRLNRLLTNNQIARSLTFQCHCPNVENLDETITGYDSRLSKQCVPKLETIWMLFWGQTKKAFSTIADVTVIAFSTIADVTVISGLLLYALFFTVKIILQSKKKEPRNVSFDELIGVDATREEFEHIISILQGKNEYKRLEVELPVGVLLYGSQRTGKTTLVHALA